VFSGAGQRLTRRRVEALLHRCGRRNDIGLVDQNAGRLTVEGLLRHRRHADLGRSAQDRDKAVSSKASAGASGRFPLGRGPEGPQQMARRRLHWWGFAAFHNIGNKLIARRGAALLAVANTSCGVRECRRRTTTEEPRCGMGHSNGVDGSGSRARRRIG